MTHESSCTESTLDLLELHSLWTVSVNEVLDIYNERDTSWKIGMEREVREAWGRVREELTE